MAIVRNMWMRNTRQQVAGAVLYNLKGQTIQREKAASVANPRTTAQMNQRVRLANLVNFYRANASWMKRGAFENKKQTHSDYNAFVSRNIGTSAIALTKEEALAGAAIACPYQVTDGSLPIIQASAVANVFTIQALGYTTSTQDTISNLTEALLHTYPTLKMGDQLSIILLFNKRDSSGIPRVVAYANEIALTDTNNLTLAGSLNAGGRTVVSAPVADGIKLTVTPESGEAIGFIVCVSRSTANGLKVSPSWVNLSDDTFVEGYSDGSQFEKAIASYGEGGVNFLDSIEVIAGQTTPAGGGDDQGGSGAGDPSDVTP